jgi:hypothetical protein
MKIPFNSFATGEIDASLSARYDLAKYKPACRLMKNFLVEVHGNARRRPGTYFLEDLGADAVLLPFQFSSDPGQCLTLVFTDLKLRFATAAGFIKLAGVPVELTTPYSLSQLLEISYAQSGDVVYLAHKSHALHKLSRFSNTNWVLSEVPFAPGVVTPTGMTGVFTSGPVQSGQVVAPQDFTLRYRVAAANEVGAVSYGSQPVEVPTARHPSDWIQGDHVDLTIPAVVGAVEYLVYREEGGYYGLVGVVRDKTENALDAVVSTTHRWAEKVSGQNNTTARLYFSSTAWATVGQQIYVTGPTKYRGTHVITAKGTGVGLVSNPYVEFVIYGAAFNEGVLFGGSLIPLVSVYTVKYAQATTFGFYFVDSKYVAQTSRTPKDEYNPFRGGNNPCLVGFHEQRLVIGGTVNSPQTVYGSMTANFEEFSKRSPLQEDDTFEHTVASGSIDAINWLASFGDLLVGTGSAEHQLTGGRNGDGITPSNVQIKAQSYWGSTQIPPLVIGNSVMHVQKQGSHVRDLFFSFEKDGYAGNDLTILAPHLFEGYTLRQWTYQQAPGSVVWCVRNDGVLLALTYMKEHDIWAWSQHHTEGQYRSICSITGEFEDQLFCVVKRTVNGVTKYFLELMLHKWIAEEGIEEAFFVDCGLSYYGTPATVISGLGHLEGKSVAVLAEGSPVEGLTVTSGSITLPYPASTVHVGLPFQSILAPMPFEADAKDGTTLGRLRTVGLSRIRVLDTVGGRYGSSPGRMDDFPYLPDDWGAAVTPYSGDLEFSPDAEHTSQTTVYIEQERPLPMTIVALMLDVAYEG